MGVFEFGRYNYFNQYFLKYFYIAFSSGISEIQIRNQVRDLTIVRSDLNQVNLEPTEKVNRNQFLYFLDYFIILFDS